MIKNTNNKYNQLIESLKNKSENAYSDLYKIFKKELYLFSLKIVRDKSLAEDVVQEVFIKIFEKIHQLKNNDAFISWMYKIAYNLCIKYLKYRDSITLFNDEFIFNITSNEYSQETIIINNEKNEYIKSLVNKLPPIHSNIIILRYYYEFSIKEISSILNIPNGSVKSRLYYAKKYLSDSYDSKLYMILYFPSILRKSDSTYTSFSKKIYSKLNFSKKYMYLFISIICIQGTSIILMSQIRSNNTKHISKIHNDKYKVPNNINSDGIKNDSINNDKVSFSINSEPIFENSKSEGNLRIINHSHNKYNFYISIRDDLTNQILFEVKELKPNQYIENARLLKELKKGVYKSTATIKFYDSKKYYLGEVYVKLNINIKN